MEFTEDSHHSIGVVCIWGGRVSCLVRITYRGALHRVMLTELGSTSWGPEDAFEEYKITYHMEPYPQAGAKKEKEKHRLELTISK